MIEYSKTLLATNIMIILLLSSNYIQGTRSTIYSSNENINKENQDSSFMFIISPNLSLNMTQGGKDVDRYDMCLMYGLNLMFEYDNNLLIEFGFSISPLKIKSEFISQYIHGPYGEDIDNVEIEETETNDTRILIGIKYLLPSNKLLGQLYLRLGGCVNIRGNSKVSYKTDTDWAHYSGNIEVIDGNNVFGINAGVGFMILVNNNIAFDLLVNANMLFQENNSSIWLQPGLGIKFIF
ncbi:MAG: hypothetical protein V1720_03610 [bacterium]